MQPVRLVLTLALALAVAPLGATQLVINQRVGGQTNGQTRQGGPPVPSSPQPTGAIWGTVVSGTSGQPVDRVRLRLTGGDASRRTSRSIYTDDDGRFAFLDLPPGTYTLSGSKTGYVGVSYGQSSPAAGRPGTPIDLQPGQQIKDMVFQLPPGGVITGVIFDEKNRPSVATPVRVMRWTMANGERRLASAGTATTDDRGIYRVYGLAPGEYLVSAMPRNTGIEQSAEMAWVLEERMAEIQAQGLPVASSLVAGNVRMVNGPEGQFVMLDESPESVDAPNGYAPVFYPGTLDVGGASTVRVGVSEVVTSVDVALQQVPLSRIEGAVIVPPDANARTIQVRLYNTAVDVPGVSTRTSRVRDGSFSFTGVPPGVYRVVATADVRGEPERRTQVVDGRQVVVASSSAVTDRIWGMSDVTVAGQNMSNVMLVMQPGLKASGTVMFDGAGQRPQGRIRINLSPFGAAAAAAGATRRTANVDESGRFEVAGLVPATYRVTATGVSGWTIKQALYGGVDTLDYALDLTSAQDADGIIVAFTDQRTEVTGRITDGMGAPASGMTVVIFPMQESYWGPESRRIQSTSPSTSGAFSFSNLPPGDYRLAVVYDVEPGIWYDPQFLRQLAAAATAPFSLQPGQTVNQNVQVGR